MRLSNLNALERTVALLGAKLRSDQASSVRHILRTILVTDYIDEPRRNALAPGEHIVLDWYRDEEFEVWARERITTDPHDEGRRCEGHPPLPPGYTDLPYLVIEIDQERPSQGVCAQEGAAEELPPENPSLAERYSSKFS